MKKSVILTFILIVFCLVLFLISYSFIPSDLGDKTYTSAVCDGNSCRDYVFTCRHGEIVDSTPISGFVTFGDGWVDEREKRDLC